MKFLVKFSSGKVNYAVNKERQTPGINWIEITREELELPQLSLSIFSEMLQSYKSDPFVSISEQIARKSNLFQSKNKVEVSVPIKFLNLFCVIKNKIDINKKTGEIKSIIPCWGLNEKQIIIEWEKAGFPLEWRFNAEDAE